MQDAERRLAFVGGNNLRGGLVAAAVEEHDLVALAVAQHVQAVMRLVASENRRVREQWSAGTKKRCIA